MKLTKQQLTEMIKEAALISTVEPDTKVLLLFDDKNHVPMGIYTDRRRARRELKKLLQRDKIIGIHNKYQIYDMWLNGEAQEHGP